MSVVCCAASALMLLSHHNFKHHSSMCTDRCGPLCLGTGHKGDSKGCYGCMVPASSVTPPKFSSCDSGDHMLHDFKYRSTNKNNCDTSECIAINNKIVRVNPPHAIKIIASRRKGKVEIPSAVQQVVFSIEGDYIPPYSTVTGPGTIKCLNRRRLHIGHSSTLTNIHLDCPETCSGYIEMPTHKTTQTAHMINVTSTQDCTLLVAPIDPKRQLTSTGKINIHSLTAGTHQPKFDVAVANYIGDLAVNSYNTSKVLLLEVHPDFQKSIKLSAKDTPGGVNVFNLSALLNVFGPEYLIEYYNNGKELKGIPMPPWIVTANTRLIVIILVELMVLRAYAAT